MRSVCLVIVMLLLGQPCVAQSALDIASAGQCFATMRSAERCKCIAAAATELLPDVQERASFYQRVLWAGQLPQRRARFQRVSRAFKSSDQSDVDAPCPGA